MFGVVFLLLIVVPLLELYVIVQVASGIGALWTILLLLVISSVGAWLVRREGIGVFARIQQQLSTGNLPSKEIADGALIMLGGTLLLTPGFVTDAVGLALLLPPVRAVVRMILLKRLSAKRVSVTSQFTQSGGAMFDITMPPRGPNRDVIDVDVTRSDQVETRPGLEP